MTSRVAIREASVREIVPRALLLIITMFSMSMVEGNAQRTLVQGSRPIKASPQTSYQIQLAYVLPSDGVDRRRDQDGTIRGSVSVAQRWMSAQTGGRHIGLVELGGVPTIVRTRLSRTDAELAAYGDRIVEQIEFELHTQGFSAPNTLYAVYYEGSGTRCGVSTSPPDAPGSVFVLLLDGLAGALAPCADQQFATSGSDPGYWEFSFLHEFMHAIGAVPDCAPNSDGDHHVADPYDLMFAGGGEWDVRGLDLGQDDYFGHGRRDCFDAARSPFLRPLPTDAAPALGFTDTTVSANCNLRNDVPRATFDEVALYVVNASADPVSLFWIDNHGREQEYQTLDAWQDLRINSTARMPWFITNSAGVCLGSFTTPANPVRAWYTESSRATHWFAIPLLDLGS